MEKRNFISWVKNHKKELTIAGFSVVTIIAIILGYKNRNELISLMRGLEKAIKKNSKSGMSIENATMFNENTILKQSPNVHATEMSMLPEIPQEISSHVRNLHEGWNASAEKIATAAENGYVLQPGQTWVESYTKYKTAA